MSTQNCIRVSYRGLKHYIICNTNTCYEDFIDLVCERFEISKEIKNAIMLTNGHNYIFRKEFFEYIIMLFPSPQFVLHVLLDLSKISISHNVISGGEHQVRLNKKRSYAEIFADDTEKIRRPIAQYIMKNTYNTVTTSPVRRQNCFLGALPTDTTETAAVQPQQHIAKRMRLMPSPVDIKKSAMKSTVKRSLRS